MTRTIFVPFTTDIYDTYHNFDCTGVSVRTRYDILESWGIIAY